MCRRVGLSLPLLIVAWCALVPLFASLCGCGGSNTTGGRPDKGYSAERQIVEGLLSSVSDAESFDYVFVEGKVPESQRELYTKYKFHAELDDAVVDGSGKSATISVQVQDSGGNGVGEEVQWKAVKEGNEWKLTSAPLPAAAK